MEGQRERCAPHGLAVGPDGRCVLCRQGEAPAQASPVDTAPLRNPFVWTAIAAALLAVVVVAKVVYSRALVHVDPDSSAGVGMAATTPPATDPDTQAPPAAEPNRRRPISVSTPAELGPETSDGTQAPPDRPGAATADRPDDRQAQRKQAPTEEELRAALRRVSITMYSTDWCPSCQKARAWFRANNVAIDDLDVEKNESAHRAQLMLNPKGSIPTIDVDGEVMVGFGAEYMRDMLRRAAKRRAQKL